MAQAYFRSFAAKVAKIIDIVKRGDKTMKIYNKKENEQPTIFQVKLLTSLSPIAVRTRLELVTPCVTGMYSNQLN